MKPALFSLYSAAILSLVGARAQEIKSPNFAYEELYSGNGMTAMDFDPEGRMFVCEKQGRVLIFKPRRSGGFSSPDVFADFRKDVNPENESGLLGIALDPRFARNHFVYVFFTSDTDQRLVRITADSKLSGMLPGSELILLKGLPRTATNHKAGDIHFHPQDPKAIYLVLGDDTKRELAGDLGYYNGKLLRLDASNGKGLSDNPFYDGNPDSIRSRVWAKGFRNPFRFAFVPGGTPNFIYVSENGDGTDRLALVKRGADAGWGRHGDKGLINPEDPNTHVLYSGRPCLTSIAIAPKGPFAADGPVLYAANWFTQELYRWSLDEVQLGRITPLPEDGGGAFMSGFKFVDAHFGPDGSLYMLQTYYGPSEGRDHKLSRVVFKAGR